MTNAPRKVVIALVTVFATIALSSFSLAQTEEQKADQTGTNPINFSKDFRVYDNYTWLNFGDGGANVLTAEYRTPFAGGKWQWRVRARYTGIEADLNNDGFDEIDQTGMGDIDMRFLTVLNMNMEKKTAMGSRARGLPRYRLRRRSRHWRDRLRSATVLRQVFATRTFCAGPSVQIQRGRRFGAPQNRPDPYRSQLPAHGCG